MLGFLSHQTDLIPSNSSLKTASGQMHVTKSGLKNVLIAFIREEIEEAKDAIRSSTAKISSRNTVFSSSAMEPAEKHVRNSP